MSTAAEEIQALFDSAIKHGAGAAPGAQFVVFDKERVLVNGVSGFATLSSSHSRAQAVSQPQPSSLVEEDKDDGPGLGVRMCPETPHWLASAGKIAVSLLAIMVLERNASLNTSDADNGKGMRMTLADLDDHDKLVEVLPEFKLGSGHLVTKIIEGFEDHLDSDSEGRKRKIPILRDAKTGVTLRMLLTHTAGLAYSWNHPLIYELYSPSDGSLPLKLPLSSGLIDSFDIPAVHEPGTTVSYGVAADWVGQFVVRSTGMNLRALLSKWIFEPLGMASTECDAAKTTAIASRLATSYVRGPSGEGFIAYEPSHAIYTLEGDPAPGYAYLATVPTWSSTQAHCKLLQAILRHDERLLTEESWCIAEGDALKGTGVEVPVPRVSADDILRKYGADGAESVSLKSRAVPAGAFFDVEFFSTPVDRTKCTSMNLFQCDLATSPTLSGRRAGSYGWGGAANSYYAIDPVNGLGWMYSVQVLPYFDPVLVKLRDDFERLIYARFLRQGNTP